MNRRWLRYAVMATCAAAMLFAVVKLIGYAASGTRSQQTNTQLAEVYHAPTAAPTSTAAAAAQAAETMPVPTEMDVAAAITPAPTVRTPAGIYPDNPDRVISERFVRLQQRNPDICGWLSIDGVLDQPVVWRDNEFYLTHDAKGEENVNGAIFLDEQIRLVVRPRAYILYGHNMRTQAMFGMLHKYDDIAYLQSHRVIDLDALYENGKYVIFAAGVVSIAKNATNYVDYFRLPGADDAECDRIVTELDRISTVWVPLEVDAGDQLLILVTCTGDSTTRRFVAARRLRPGETGEMLDETYRQAKTK